MAGRVYIRYTGCPTSWMEYKIMKEILKESGYEIVEDPKDADAIVLHLCVIKGPSESNALRLVRKFLKEGKKVVVSGCLAEYKGKELYERYKVNVVGINRIHKIIEAIEKENFFETSGERYPKCKFSWDYGVVEPLVIEEGCEFNCSYCVDKLIRGRLYSYPKDIIVKRFKEMIRKGVKEVWITGQDSGAWGRERGEKLPDLLKEILKVDGNYRIRIGMMNPPYAKLYFEELVEIFEDPRVYKFLHIPLQSGNNRVLRLMRRPYTVEDFLETVEMYRREIPKISIATDVIVGFPTETEEEFWDTVEVIKKVKPDFLNISRFWPRPGTDAAKMKLLPGWETKRRSRIMTREYEKISLEKNKEWVGWKGEVLVNERGKDAFISRNIYYKPIVIRENVNLGEFLRVKVKEAKTYFLEGKLY